jgi:PAS domain S-box-containing protein
MKKLRQRQQIEETLRIQRDLAITLNAASDLPAALDRVLEAVLQIEGIDCGGVYLVDRLTGELNLVVSKGLPPQFVERAAHYDAAAPQTRLVMAGKPIYQPYTEVLSNAKAEIHRQEALRALVVIPVVYEGQVIAVLNLASHTYEETPIHTRQILETIAAQIGAAIARLKAEESLREAHNELEHRVEERTVELNTMNESLRREISERRQMETALRASEEKFRALFESLQDVFYRIDATGNVLLTSPSIIQLLGYSQEEAVRLNLGQHLFVEPAQWHEFAAHLITQEHLKDFEVLLKRCDGSQVWGSLTSQWYTDQEGHILGIEGMIRDITDRKQAEAKLQELRKAVETMPLGVTITGIDRKIMYTNPADAAMHGYTVAELLGQDVSIFAPAHLHKPLPLAQIETMKEWIRETVNIRKDGSTFPVQLGSDLVKDETGKIMAIVTTCEDITERKRTEEELQKYREHLVELVQERTVALEREIAERKRMETWLLSMNEQLEEEIAERKKVEKELQQAKEAAEAANAAKSTFLANMSHELRTPLNAILGYAQILKETPNLSNRHKEGLEIIKRSGEHLLTLINDILDISKIEAGHMEIQVSEVYFIAFLKHIADMFQIRAESQGITFVFVCDPDAPVGIYADEKRLRQVLINLLGNAVKFTEKGSVTFRVKIGDPVETGRRPVSANTDNPVETGRRPVSTRLIFEIEDTGIGIAPERIPEIFLPFHQLGERRQGTEGTGLGLAISRQLVEAMGGTLSAQSTVGKGSLFWFDLTLTEIPGFTPKTVSPMRKITGYRGNRRTILITDDEPENRSVLVNILAPLGFELLEAENGQECLEKTLQFTPDVILLDIRMPVMNGFEVARRIRNEELRIESRPVIIAVSASVFEESRKKSLDAGCDDFLAKPFQVEDLLDLFQKYLQNEWIYAEPPEEQAGMKPRSDTEREQIVDLPLERRKNLLAFADRGSLTKILAELNEIEQIDAQYAPLVQTLRQLAKNFRFDEIVKLLERD